MYVEDPSRCSPHTEQSWASLSFMKVHCGHCRPPEMRGFTSGPGMRDFPHMSQTLRSLSFRNVQAEHAHGERTKLSLEGSASLDWGVLVVILACWSVSAVVVEREVSEGSSCLECDPLLLMLILLGDEEVLILFLLLRSNLFSVLIMLFVFFKTSFLSSQSSLSWGAVSKPAEMLSYKLFLLVRLGKTSGPPLWDKEWELLLELEGLSTLSRVSLSAIACNAWLMDRGLFFVISFLLFRLLFLPCAVSEYKFCLVIWWRMSPRSPMSLL